MNFPNVDFKAIAREGLAKDLSIHNVRPEFKEMSIENRRAIADNDRLPYHVMCMNVEGNINIGVVIRNAHLFGAKSVVVMGRTRSDGRSEVGMGNYTDVIRIHSLNPDLSFDENIFINYINENNLFPIFVETGGEMLGQFSWDEKMYAVKKQPIFILGNETTGIDENILNTRHLWSESFVVGIPMRGVGRSLNLGVASGVIMWDFVHNMGWM